MTGPARIDDLDIRVRNGRCQRRAGRFLPATRDHRGRDAPPGAPAGLALGIPALGIPALGIPALGIPALGIPALGIPALGILALGGQ
ncbi:MAG TPA: hypothetical protein VK162_23590, partial [Streptosporangiaceae bacterium]|nr:hypothetical protein [Streptosporangiaceae bacterium]